MLLLLGIALVVLGGLLTISILFVAGLVIGVGGLVIIGVSFGRPEPDDR